MSFPPVRIPMLFRDSLSHTPYSLQVAFSWEAQGSLCPDHDHNASENHREHTPTTKCPSYFVQDMLMWQNNPSNNIKFSTSGKIDGSHTIMESVSNYSESKTKQPPPPLNPRHLVPNINSYNLTTQGITSLWKYIIYIKALNNSNCVIWKLVFSSFDFHGMGTKVV